jgi:hypothetical protein
VLHPLTPHTRKALLGTVALAGSTVLMFPEPFGEQLPTAVAYVALAGAVVALCRRPALQGLMLWLSVAAIIAVQRAEGAPSALSHFTNLALGLLVFGMLAGWKWKLRQSTYPYIAACVIATAFVATGILLTDWSAVKIYPLSLPLPAPRLRNIVLPGLSAGGANANVVGAMAAILLPLAVGMVRFQCVSPLKVALSGTMIAFGIIGIILSQSMSAIAAVPLSLCTATGLTAPPGRRWLAMVPASVLVLGAAVLAMRPINWLSSSENLIFHATATDATLERLEARPDSAGNVWKLSPQTATEKYGLTTPLNATTGLYRVCVQAKAEQTSIIRLYSSTFVIDYNNQNGTYSDGGHYRAVVRTTDDGWTSIDLVAPLVEATTVVGLEISDALPTEKPIQGGARESKSSNGVLIRQVHANKLVSSWDRLVGLIVVAHGRALSSLDARTEIWKNAIGLYEQSPWTGIGLNTFRFKHGTLRGPDVGNPVDLAHAHNQVLQCLLDFGLFGLIPFAGIPLLAIKALRVRRRRQVEWSGQDFGFVGAAIILVWFGVFDAIAPGAKVGLIWWLVWGGVFATAQKTEPSLPSPE